MDLDQAFVRRFYNRTSRSPSDRWHDRQSAEVARFLKREALQAPLVNVGSGGRTDLPLCPQVHLDIAMTPLMGVAGAVVANAEALPIRPHQFAGAICVGSVLNYCDAARLIFEVSRTLRPGALFILEFERSNSVEYLGTVHHSQSVSLAQVLFCGEPHAVWLYSDRYILQLVRQAAFVVRRRRYFHILSAVIHRLSGKQENAARWSRWDVILARIPLLRSLAGNLILSCEKI